jgi:DNA-binding response OmpR family regulator
MRESLFVLVVDDEPDTVATLTEILRDEGHRIVGAHSVPAALRHIAEERPDAVIADIHLPGVSGYELARELRRIYSDQVPMLIAVSGIWKGQTDRMLAELSGFQFFLEKPCDPRVVVSLLAPLKRREAPPVVSLTEVTAPVEPPGGL